MTSYETLLSRTASDLHNAPESIRTVSIYFYDSPVDRGFYCGTEGVGFQCKSAYGKE
ncbi:hypothetical protein MUO74_07095 [Candidatus Bathyarchaeota archaeon]|nr:hypothetical protein [Candidatus Bathyarchaeota archaeon]